MSVAPSDETGNSYQVMLSAITAYMMHRLSFYIDNIDSHLGCGKHGKTKRVKQCLSKTKKLMTASAPDATREGDLLVPDTEKKPLRNPNLLSSLPELKGAWDAFAEGLPDKARQAKDTRKQMVHKPSEGNLSEKEAERLNRIEQFNQWKRENSTMVQSGGELVKFIIAFCEVFGNKELHVAQPTFEAFLGMAECPKGFKDLSATFSFQLAIANDLAIQRFVANSIAYLAIEDAALIGAQGMDRLGELALVPDDEVQLSCVCAAFKVAIADANKETQAKKLAEGLIEDIRQAEGSKKASAAAIAALATIKGGDVAMKVAEKGAEAVGKAAAATENLFNKGKSLMGKD